MSFTKDQELRRAINRAVWLHQDKSIDLLEARKVASKQFGIPISKISKKKCEDWIEYLRCKKWTDMGICPNLGCSKEYKVKLFWCYGSDPTQVECEHCK